MENEIFVFGSNLAGRHGKGAALYALQHHGAAYGQGVGLQGSSYAIPTKDSFLRTLPLSEINKYVHDFLIFARSGEGRNFLFNVTRIGCGLAGYKDEDIAPMFSPVVYCPNLYKNVKLPKEWEEYFAKEKT